jgi:hypothetical protein
MSRWPLRLGQYCLIVAMFFSCGGHWLLLQSVAWGGMIMEYARADGIASAVGTVLDGRHPCDLCKQIQKGRSKEQKPEAPVNTSRFEFFLIAAPVFIAPVVPSWRHAVVTDYFPRRTTEPLVRPPRASVA